jgi:Tfp pilus assembly protein PilF
MRQITMVICAAVFLGAGYFLPGAHAQVSPAEGARIDSLYKAKNWTEVVKELDATYPRLQNDKQRIRWSSILSIVFNELKQYDNAGIAMYRVLSMAPKSGASWGNLGWYLYLQDKLDSAQIVSEKALALDSTLIFVMGNIGLIQLRKGKDVAMQTYQRTGDKLFEMGDAKTFDAICEDIANDKDKLQKNKNLYNKVVAYLDGMKSMIKQKAELEESKP